MRVAIHRIALALPALARAGAKRGGRIPIGHESQPVEIVEQVALVRGTRALPIVVLDAQQHPPPERSGQAPDVDAIDDVPEVEMAGRRGREPRERVRRGPGEPLEEGCRAGGGPCRGLVRCHWINHYDRWAAVCGRPPHG